MSSAILSKTLLQIPAKDGFTDRSSRAANISRLNTSLQIPARQMRSRRLEVRAGTGNSFGNLFRVTTFGESHGGGVGCVIDGCPPRIPIEESDLQKELDRRRPGQSRITTPRKETDTCKILSGLSEGQTTGTPIAVLVPNTDQRGQMSMRTIMNFLVLEVESYVLEHK